MKTKIKYILFLTLGLLIGQSRVYSQGPTCASAAPFCSDTTISFAAGTGTGSAGNKGCLGTTPNPAWYYFQVLQPGRINVHLWTTPQRDLDFICWGPFDAGNIVDLMDQNVCGELLTNCGSCTSHDPSNGANPASLGGYPVGNIVDCSYSPSDEEYVHIPNAQTGQWYIFLITNYSNQACGINFNRDTSSTGSSNCSILVPAVALDDIVCEGDTAKLKSAYTNPQYTYTWTGPNGFYQSGPNPDAIIPNVSLAAEGTYSLTYSTIDSTGAPAYCDLLVHPLPDLMTPTFDTIYFGEVDTMQVVPSTSYHWSTGFTGNPLIVTPNRSQDYLVTATSNFGCADTLITHVKVINAPIIHKNPDVDHICQGYPVLADVTYRMTTLACTDKFEYRIQDTNNLWTSWMPYVANDTIHSDTLLGIELRAYQLTCNDAGNLFNSDTTTVFWIVHPQITRASYVRIPEESGICLGASLTLTVDTLFGMPIVMEYQYQPPTTSSWTNGNIFTPVNPGLAWIRGRVASGDYGCLTTEWDWFSWLVQPQPQILGLASQQLCPHQTVTLNANVVDGYGATFYKWEKSSGDCSGVWDSIPGLDTAIMHTPILDTTVYYRLQVTQSGYNCATTSSCIVLQVNPSPTITIVNDTTICATSMLTVVSTVVDGAGTNHYQYQYRYVSSDPWTNVGIDDDTLQIPGVTQTMDIRCLLTQSGLGCEDTSNVITVYVNTPPTITQQPVSVDGCDGFAAQFTVIANANPAPSYQWIGPNGIIASGITNIIDINPVTIADTGYYRCVISNSCGVIVSDSVHLNIVPTYTAPTAIIGTTKRCVGLGWDVYSADPINPASYSWSIAPPACGTINPTTGQVAWDALWNGTATISFQSSGCGLNNTITLDVTSYLPVQDPTVITGDTSRCQGLGTSQYTTNAVNDTALVWSLINAGNSTIDAASGLVSWDQQFNGIATVSVFARGCQGPTVTISQTVHVLPAPIMFISDSLDRCEGESATFMATHLDTNSIMGYQWFGPAGLITGALDSILNITPITIADSGSYYCQITIGCGFAVTPFTKLTVHHRPMPSFTATPNCMRDTVFFANTSLGDDLPFTYLWHFGDGDSSQLFSPGHIYADSGSYNVTLIVENAFGCKDSSTSVVPAFSLPFFNLVTTNDSCFGDANGTILVNVNFGLPPYSYIINTELPQDTNYYDSLATGLYTITVTDGNNCLVKDTVTITQPPVLQSVYVRNDVRCYSDSTGTILLAVEGGTQPYRYVWSHGDSVQNATHLPIGFYSVSITDAMGCNNQFDSILIMQPNPLVIDSISKPTSCSLVNDAMIAVYPEGGYGFYQYLWSDNSTNDSLINLAPGNYSVTVTDENGCTHVSNYTIPYNPEICWEIWTSFSPDGDGVNDKWNIRWASIYPNMIIQIFNRWGALVYENKGEFNGWDGTGKSGKLLPSETYYYVINLNDGSTPIQTGTVTIVY
jgi:gliding motility-associated-like protein